MIEKIDWDVYYMTQAFLVAQKSIDPSTKHGSIWVSDSNRILSEGYNGPLQNIDDNKVPLTRPEKYYWILHSEENCLLSYGGRSEGLENSKIYITGRPCHRCLRMMIQKGIKKIIYAEVNSACIDQEDMKAQTGMLSLKADVKMIEFKNMDKVIDLFNKSLLYINAKSNRNK